MDGKTLSINCITYNHEKFIAQAMDGFLMQETDFDFEIVVGEDCSTDNTRQILLAYKEKYPDKIKLLLNEKNMGMQQNGAQTGAACTGRYMAICEGDDYWTDPLKLQKQVDFLEANPDFATTFHRVEIKFEDSGKESELSNENQKETTTFEDLAAGNFIHTLSCVFRTNLFGDLPEWYNEMPIGDYPLHLLNAQYGKIKFFEDTMGVYRIHNSGSWGHMERQKSLPKWALVVEQCYRHFYPKGRKQFEKALASFYRELAFYEFRNGNYERFQNHYLKLLGFSRQVPARELLALSIRFSLSYLPPVADWYRNFRQ